MTLQHNEKTFGLNRNQLKYIAVFFMIVDNLFHRINGPSILHMITRFVAPLYAWLVVDGFFHTRNRGKYCKRLWMAAILMQCGNCLSFVLLGVKDGISDNVFLTLAVGFSMIYLWELSNSRTNWEKPLLRVGAAGLLLGGLALSITRIPLFMGSGIMIDGGLVLLPLMVIAYFFHDSKAKQAILYFAWCLFLGITCYGFPASLFESFDLFCTNSDWLTLFVIPFMFLYNGKPGKTSSFNKKFFYIFYPAHLWVIYVVAFLLNI